MSSFESNPTKKTILVVEDDVDSRLLYRRILEAEDYETFTAANGIEALAYLETGKLPNLILLDIWMPDMMGDEFLKKIREIPRLTEMKVVFMSGWDDIAKRTQEAGASGYIKKPVDLEVLCREVSSHLGDV